MKNTLKSAISFSRTSVVVGLLTASLMAMAACGSELGTPDDDPTAGQSCTSNEECTSGRCVGAASCDSEREEGPVCEPTEGVCAAAANLSDADGNRNGDGDGNRNGDGDDDGDGHRSSNNKSGSCGDVAHGEYLCDSNVVYECVHGSKVELKDCRRCKYIGAGSGHKYKTSCRSNASWKLSNPNEPYPGPGCYFGSSLICD